MYCQAKFSINSNKVKLTYCFRKAQTPGVKVFSLIYLCLCCCIGTFAVACLMVGTAVTKGYNSVTSGGEAVTSTLIHTGNDTNASIPLPSGGESDDEAMSDEELEIRLQFAMSVTLMVGAIQVCL